MLKGSLGSPSAAITTHLVFSGGDAEYRGSHSNGDGEDDEDRVQEAEWELAENEDKVKVEEGAKRRESMYVALFEDMLITSLGKEESQLFSGEELDCFYRFSRLSYNARYLLIRLLLRRANKWHRLDSLKYQAELGDCANIVSAIDEICHHEEDVEVKEEQEVIDLTMDDVYASSGSIYNQQAEQITGPSTSDGQAQTVTDVGDLDLSTLAQDEGEMDLRCLLECLTVDELKSFAKDMKIKTVQKRPDIISALLNNTPAQTTLNFTKHRLTSKSGGVDGPFEVKNALLFSPGQKCKTQQDRLREMVTSKLSKCIRINSAFRKLVMRAHLVCFRLTQYTPTLLTTSILCRAKKRCYPSYEWSRTPDIWPSREALIAYEEALELEATVDGFLDSSSSSSSADRTASKTPARAMGHHFRTPSTAGSNIRASISDTPDKKGKGRALVEDNDEELKMETKDESPRLRSALNVKAIFEEIYPRWKALVITKGEEDGRRSGLERFDCGHVLTRIVCKGTYALGMLKEHRYELEVLEELLSQRRWRRGRRGRWHDRRALILMTYFPKDETTGQRALDAVIEGLKDEDTHIVHRPMLERRLCRLEKRLNIPPEERHVSEAKLKQAIPVVIRGVRIRNRASSLAFMMSPIRPDQELPKMKSKEDNDNGKKGKSTWGGRNGEVVNVETFALQYYEDKGFKGIHCETRVIHMLFGLLFWDIIFAPVRGAFETPFQSAPLDIAEDYFYHSRKEIIEERLKEIEFGNAQEIIAKIDDEHRAKGTWCIGVKWELFTKQDLTEIVVCLGGSALSVICRLLCEDYTGRSSGGPDLFVWNAQQSLCKFVEVKGPGDTLQENQKVWIDVLLRASISVEVCRVVEEGADVDKVLPKGKKKKKVKREPASKTEEDIESEDDPDELPTMRLSTPTRSTRSHPTPNTSTIPRAARKYEDDIDWTPSQPSKKRGTPAIDLAQITPRKRPRVQQSNITPT